MSRRPIDSGGSEGGRGGSLPMCSLRTKKPTLSGWVWCSCESRRQAMMTMISTRSVGRSVGRSRGSGHYFGAVAAFASSPCLESAYVSRRFLHPQPRHSFALCGHPSEKRLRLDAREKLPHLTGSTAGGQPAGVVVSVVVFPTSLGLPPPNVEPILL